MIERPVFKRHLHVEAVPSEGVFLLSERGHHHLSGTLFERVAPWLNGTLTSDEIAAGLSGEQPMAETYYALLQLERDGLIAEADFLTPEPQAAFWSSLGVDTRQVWQRFASDAVRLVPLLPESGPALAHALWRHGLRVDPGGAFTVVVVGDYLAPELAEINREALRSERPWMLVKPVGTAIWVGPIFVPGRTGCWECLAQRLRGHRDLETLLGALGRQAPVPLSKAALPASIEQALSLAAVQVAIWMGSGGNATLEGRVVTQDVTTLAGMSHELVRRPQCPACGDGELLARRREPVVLRSVGKAATQENGHRATTPEAMLGRYGRHVSPVTGVISTVTPYHTDPSQPLKLYVADHNFALMHDLKFFLRDGIRSNSAGKGMTDVQAQASAVGEGIERYSGVFRGEEARRRGSLRGLGEAAIHPNDCMLFSQRQYAERQAWNARESRFQFVPQPLPEEADLEWSPVWSLGEKTFKYLPTPYLYYGYPNPQDEIYCWADSNGCAAGSTLEEAILQGFLELIERDAVALWWYNRLRRPAVDLDSFDLPYVGALREHYAGLARELWVLDLTSDFGIPVFAAVNRRTDHPVEDIILGFGAHLDSTVALTRALTEMNQFMPAVLPRNDAGDCIYAFNDPEAIDWWRTATLENRPYLAPAADGGTARGDHPDLSTDDLAADVQQLVELAAAKGHDTLVLDQTRPDIGLPVAKVIVPGLRHFWARYAPGRLYSTPVELGWAAEPTPEEALNPIALFI